MGDAADNIPGVRGIGAKTAIALIQEFHSIENLYAHLDEIGRMNLRGAARIRKALAEGKAAVFLSRNLARSNPTFRSTSGSKSFAAGRRHARKCTRFLPS
jgi:DNA polymerase-1